jgi:hypothetical protein
MQKAEVSGLFSLLHIKKQRESPDLPCRRFTKPASINSPPPTIPLSDHRSAARQNGVLRYFTDQRIRAMDDGPQDSRGMNGLRSVSL